MTYTVIGDEKFLVSATIQGGGSNSWDDLSANPLTAVNYALNSTTLSTVVADTTNGGTHALYYDNAPVPYTSMKKQYTNYDDIPNGKCNNHSTYTLCGWFKAIPYYRTGSNYFQTRFGYGGNEYVGSTNLQPVCMFYDDRMDRLSFKSDGLSQNWMVYRNPSLLDSGLWQHWIYWYNGSQKRVYVNGVLRASANATGSMQNITNAHERQMRIGFFPADGFAWAGAGTAPYFNGYADDLRFFDRALSTTEIASLASGRTSAPPTSGVTSGVYDPFTNKRFNAGNAKVR
jgi:hypothetical protein